MAQVSTTRCPFRNGRFWSEARPHKGFRRRPGSATLRTETRGERRTGPKDAIYGWTLPKTRLKVRTHRIIASSVEETLHIGAFVGRYLSSGSIVTLHGELGSGKTCLTQGIAQGLKVPEGFYVTSPSYSLINEYPGRLPLFHVDLYRVRDAGELEQLGLEDIVGGKGVTVIEWAEKLAENLPNERLDVSMSIVDERIRALQLTGYGSQAVDLVERCLEQFPWH